MDLLCPQCSAAVSGVIESRGNRRRRECSTCLFRWSTYEVPGERMRELEEIEQRWKNLSDLLRDGEETVPAALDIELPP